MNNTEDEEDAIPFTNPLHEHNNLKITDDNCDFLEAFLQEQDTNFTSEASPTGLPNLVDKEQTDLPSESQQIYDGNALYDQYVQPSIQHLKESLQFILDHCSHQWIQQPSLIPNAFHDYNHPDHFWLSVLLQHHYNTNLAQFASTTTTPTAAAAAATLTLPPLTEDWFDSLNGSNNVHSYPTTPILQLPTIVPFSASPSLTVNMNEQQQQKTISPFATQLLPKKRGRKPKVQQEDIAQRTNALKSLETTSTNAFGTQHLRSQINTETALPTLNLVELLHSASTTPTVIFDQDESVEYEETTILVYDPDRTIYVLPNAPPMPPVIPFMINKQQQVKKIFAPHSTVKKEGGISKIIRAPYNHQAYQQLTTTSQDSSPVPSTTNGIDTNKSIFMQFFPNGIKSSASHVLVNNGRLVVPILLYFRRDPRINNDKHKQFNGFCIVGNLAQRNSNSTSNVLLAPLHAASKMYHAANYGENIPKSLSIFQFLSQHEPFVLCNAFPGDRNQCFEVQDRQIIAHFLPSLKTLLTAERRKLYTEEELSQLDDAITKGKDNLFNYVLPTPSRFFRAIQNTTLDIEANVRLHDLRNIFPINSTDVSVSLSSFTRNPSSGLNNNDVVSHLDPSRYTIPAFPTAIFKARDEEIKRKTQQDKDNEMVAPTTKTEIDDAGEEHFVSKEAKMDENDDHNTLSKLQIPTIYRGDGNMYDVHINHISKLSRFTRPKPKFSVPVAVPKSGKEYRAIIQLRRGLTHRVYLGQRTAVLQDGRYAIELLEDNALVKLTVFSIPSEALLYETIQSSLFAELLNYYIEDAVAMSGSLHHPVPDGLHLPGPNYINTSAPEIQEYLLKNYKYQQQANNFSWVAFMIPSRWIIAVHMTFEDLNFCVENALFVPRKWQLRTFEQQELLQFAQEELKNTYDEVLKSDIGNKDMAATISNYHLGLANKYPQPLATYIRVVLHQSYASPVFTLEWFRANVNHLFTRCGALTRAQQEQIADAYFWKYLAPYSQRIPEYKNTILDIYNFQGVYASLTFPHYSTGQHRGRSSTSGILRLRDEPSKLPSRHIVSTPEGDCAMFAYKRKEKQPSGVKKEASTEEEDKSTATKNNMKKSTFSRSKRVKVL